MSAPTTNVAAAAAMTAPCTSLRTFAVTSAFASSISSRTRAWTFGR